jgi:hypothetical protein
MSTKKRPWREWVVEFIKRTDKCPGEPSFGPPAGMVTEEEFLASIKVTGTHPFHDCHFMDEILGSKLPLPDMQPLSIEEKPQFTEEDMAKFKRTLQGGLKPVDQLKKNLSMYVAMIELREGGVLYIPSQLMDLESYLKKFFDVQEKG